MKTILVTGVRGKTGREVAATLARRAGVTVRGAGRSASELNLPQVSPVHFDWDDRAGWPSVLDGVKAIYLVKPKTSDPAATVTSFLGLARDVERVVLLSEIEGGNQDDATDERRVEKVIEAAPVDWTLLRPNWFMQNFATPSFYLEAIRDAGELVVPTAGQPVSFVDARDIADVAVAALLDSGHTAQAYTLTGPQAITFAEAVGQIGGAAGHSVRHVDPPLADYLAAAAAKGTPPAFLGYLGRIYDHIQKGQTAVISPHVAQVTGHPPRTFSAFVEENKQIWRRST
jgi:uncharacterized protein YbjT (DUF2867 family)